MSGAVHVLSDPLTRASAGTSSREPAQEQYHSRAMASAAKYISLNSTFQSTSRTRYSYSATSHDDVPKPMHRIQKESHQCHVVQAVVNVHGAAGDGRGEG